MSVMPLVVAFLLPLRLAVKLPLVQVLAMARAVAVMVQVLAMARAVAVTVQMVALVALRVTAKGIIKAMQMETAKAMAKAIERAMTRIISPMITKMIYQALRS